MPDQDKQIQPLIEYRVSLLEIQYANILKLVQETHDTVTTIRAKMGENPFQCSIHGERMTQMEKQVQELKGDYAKYKGEQEEERKEQTKFIYKLMGGLSVVALIFSCIVAPIILEWAKPNTGGSNSNIHYYYPGNMMTNHP